jgi:TolB-like protein/Tfp pilus assembly protein PilF
MGEVYLAEDTQLRRRVALKVLPQSMAGDPARRSRFLREATTAASLSHPNIAVVYEAGVTDDDLPFLIMEYVAGQTLTTVLETRTLSIPEIVAIGAQIADALDDARHKRIVHRDLKPGNVMIDGRGRVKVLDFGIAKALQPDSGEATNAVTEEQETQAGVILGTAAYMSPEQAEGRSLDHRSDLFSLGATLYELVSGARAFAGASLLDSVRRVRESEPAPLTSVRADCPSELERIVHRCLEKDRERRYQTARELLLDLQTLAAHLGFVTEKRRLRWPSLAIVTALVATIGLGSVWLTGGRTSRAPAPSGPRIASVAVLPFVNMSETAEAELIADGVTEELINALARLPELKVVSRTSVFSLKGTRADVREIGRTLDVETLVEGSVRRAGNRLRVTAKLVAAEDGYHLWSQNYDREMTDVFALQDDIARSIAGVLQAKLSPTDRMIVAPTRDLEAYEHHLKGRELSTVWTSESLSKAISSFHRAIALDPRFTPAYAGLAEAYSLVDHTSPPRLFTDEEAYGRAVAAARKALEIDADSAEAHAALGHIFLHQGSFAESERHLRRAIELNPNSASAHQWYGLLLVHTNRPIEGGRHARKAEALDPLSPQIHYLVTVTLSHAGEFDAAIEASRKGLEIAPDHVGLLRSLARSYALAGRHQEAERAVQEAARRLGGSPDSEATYALVLALANRRSESLSVLERVAESTPSERRLMAMAYAALGENDRALQLLERMAAQWPNYARLNIRFFRHPAFEPLVRDPRYQDLRRRLGWPDDP